MNDAPHLFAARGGFQYFKDTVFLSLFGPFGCKGKAMGLYFVNDVISGALGVSISGKKVSAVKFRLLDVVQGFALCPIAFHLLRQLANVVYSAPYLCVALVQETAHPVKVAPV